MGFLEGGAVFWRILVDFDAFEGIKPYSPIEGEGICHSRER